MKVYDLVIIGGGVSGLVAALTAKKAGLDFILIDENKTDNFLTTPKIDITEETESLKRIIEELSLPVNAISNISIWSGSNTSFRLPSDIKDYYFVRGSINASFELTLNKDLLMRGVEIIKESKVFHIEETKDNVDVCYLEKEEEKKLKAKYVICTGFSDPYLPEELKPKSSKLFSIFGYSVGKCLLNKGFTYAFFNKEEIGDGYVYATSLENISSVAIVLNQPLDNSFKDKLDNFVAQNKILEVFNSEDKTTFNGYYSAALLNKYCTKRIFLVGDSAHLSDFFIGYGVSHAIISGNLATNTLKENLNGNSVNYDQLIKSKNEARLKGSFISWQIFRNLNDKDINNLLSVFEKLEKDIGIEKVSLNSTSYKLVVLKILFNNMILSMKLLLLLVFAKFKQYLFFKNR